MTTNDMYSKDHVNTIWEPEPTKYKKILRNKLLKKHKKWG